VPIETRQGIGKTIEEMIAKKGIETVDPARQRDAAPYIEERQCPRGR